MFEDVTERKQQELQEREQAIALARIHTLSVRQREVLVLLAEGMPNKAIASRLGVSERTVEKHRSNLMRTLQLDNIPDLIRLYLAAGADTVTLVHA